MKIEDVNTKIPNTNELIKKTGLLKINIDYNTQITEIINKIPSVTVLVTTAALNTKTTDKLKIKQGKLLISPPKPT